MNILLFLSGCLSVGQFEKRYATEACQLAQDCEVLDLEGFSTLESCQNETVPFTEDCEEYDQEKARKCLDTLRASSCEDGMSGPPQVCEKVCLD
jgi:hypothetical protein